MVDDPQLHRIGEVADRVGLSLRTVRYYEEQGLVVPESRTEGGFRLYAERQIERLLLVKSMKPLGFSLDEMRELLLARETVAEPGAGAGARRAAAATISDFAGRVDERVERLRGDLERGEAFARELRAGR